MKLSENQLSITINNQGDLIWYQYMTMSVYDLVLNT